MSFAVLCQSFTSWYPEGSLGCVCLPSLPTLVHFLLWWEQVTWWVVLSDLWDVLYAALCWCPFGIGAGCLTCTV